MSRSRKALGLAALVASTSLGSLGVTAGDALAQKAPPTKPGGKLPAKPGDKPVDAKPGDKPADAKPGDKPAEPPADAKPPEAKPVDAPTDAKPAEGDGDKGKATGIDEARRRMELGQGHFSKGEYAKAAVEFEAAYAALPNVAFLFNAAYAAEKAGDRQRAIAQYEKYLVGDPTTPERQQIEETIARLRNELTTVTETPGGEQPVETGAKPADEKAMAEIRSLVLVESEPQGAPIEIFERTDPTAPPFKAGQANAGWRKVVSRSQTPKYVSLKVGHYHVVIDAFQDYKRSETNINLAPGQVYIFKANLSQGEFLGSLRVKSNVEGGKVYLDDPKRKTAPWARTQQVNPLNEGSHEILVTAPGYKPFVKKGIEIRHGQQEEIEAILERVDHGYLVLDANVDVSEIEVDGKPEAEFSRSSKTAYKLQLPAGKHTLLLDTSKKKRILADIEIPRGQELPVTAELKPSYPRGKAVALSVLGAAVGGGGGVLFWQSKQRANDASRNKDLDPVFTYGSYGAFGLGGLLLGLGIFYSVYDPLPDSELTLERAREFPDDEEATRAKNARNFLVPVPVLDQNTAGLHLVGSF